MKKKFQEYAEEFLDYLLDVRGYSETSIITYEIAVK
jgi:integrase/recombinase XerC